MARKMAAHIGATPVVVHDTTLVDVEKLNPAPYNPRKIKPAMLSALKQSIKEQGFIHPIVVQKKGMVIIAGHQRVKALRELCSETGQPLPKIPAIIRDIGDRVAKKLNITLNRVGGEFDAGLLGDLLRDLQDDVRLTTDELTGMGISADELDGLLKLDDPPPENEEIPTFGRSVTMSLSFSDTKMRDRVKKKLEERSRVEGKKSGEIVDSLMRR
jgi:ParB-like chromosome segregation protein Spo0J